MDFSKLVSSFNNEFGGTTLEPVELISNGIVLLPKAEGFCQFVGCMRSSKGKLTDDNKAVIKRNLESVHNRYEAMGIKIKDSYNGLLWKAELPEGWNAVKFNIYTDWYKVLDYKGNQKFIFHYGNSKFGVESYVKFSR